MINLSPIIIDYSSVRVALRRSGNELSLSIRDASGRATCDLFFREIKSGNLVSGIYISDLLTRPRFAGLGTYAVNLMIWFCKKNYSENITVYGGTYHVEHHGLRSTPSEKDKADSRARRNKFWQSFGFDLTLEGPVTDKIHAKLSALSCKINQNFSLSSIPESLTVEALNA